MMSKLRAAMRRHHHMLAKGRDNQYGTPDPAENRAARRHPGQVTDASFADLLKQIHRQGESGERWWVR